MKAEGDCVAVKVGLQVRVDVEVKELVAVKVASPENQPESCNEGKKVERPKAQIHITARILTPCARPRAGTGPDLGVEPGTKKTETERNVKKKLPIMQEVEPFLSPLTWTTHFCTTKGKKKYVTVQPAMAASALGWLP